MRGPIREASLTPAPAARSRHSHLALDREGAPRITHRLVEKRRIRQRGKLKDADFLRGGISAGSRIVELADLANLPGLVLSGS